MTNDTENEKVTLSVSGDVKEVFGLSNSLHISGFLKEPISKKIQLSNKLDTPIHITGMEWREDSDSMLNKRLMVNVEPVEEGQTYSVTVKGKEEFDTGHYFGNLILKTDFEPVPEKVLRVRVLINADIETYPKRVLLPDMLVPEGTSRSFNKVITILAKRGDSLVVRDAVPSRSDIAVNLREVREGKAYRCKLTIRPETRDAEYRAKITFITNYENYEEVEVEILGRVKVVKNE
ncbi:MAG: hypothetical protein R6U43_03815 [Candidatus Krumholzibacteriales bacterium]